MFSRCSQCHRLPLVHLINLLLPQHRLRVEIPYNSNNLNRSRILWIRSRQIHSGSQPPYSNSPLSRIPSKPKCPSPTPCWTFSRPLPRRWMATCFLALAVFSSLASQWASNLNRHLEVQYRPPSVSQQISNWRKSTLSKWTTNLSIISSWNKAVRKCLLTTLQQATSPNCPSYKATPAIRLLKSSTLQLFITLDRCRNRLCSSRFKGSNLTKLFQICSAKSPSKQRRRISSRCTSHLSIRAACSSRFRVYPTSRCKTSTLVRHRTRPSQI